MNDVELHEALLTITLGGAACVQPCPRSTHPRAVAWGKALSTRWGDFVHPYDRG